MTEKCKHPINQVEVSESGHMYFSAVSGPEDTFHPIYYCKQCKQIVSEKELPWLHEPSGTKQEPIPI